MQRNGVQIHKFEKVLLILSHWTNRWTDLRLDVEINCLSKFSSNAVTFSVGPDLQKSTVYSFKTKFHSKNKDKNVLSSLQQSADFSVC